jgi:hypothetical protein
MKKERNNVAASAMRLCASSPRSARHATYSHAGSSRKNGCTLGPTCHRYRGTVANSWVNTPRVAFSPTTRTHPGDDEHRSEDTVGAPRIDGTAETHRRGEQHRGATSGGCGAYAGVVLTAPARCRPGVVRDPATSAERRADSDVTREAEAVPARDARGAKARDERQRRKQQR